LNISLGEGESFSSRGRQKNIFVERGNFVFLNILVQIIDADDELGGLYPSRTIYCLVKIDLM
jgi:hypothetical protein